MSDTSVYGLIGLTEESVGLDRRIYTGLTSTDPTLAVSYNSGRVDVFLNGVKLVGNHSEMPSGTKDYTFTATGQGSTITLATGVALVSSDVVEVMGYVSNSANTVTTYNYTASDGDTAFTANNSSGDLVNVFLNGVLLDSSDYNLTTANTVTLGSGAAASDIVHIQVIGALDNSNFVPATGGTFSGNVAVSGNLTVDTDTLKVDSSGNKVGIGATSGLLGKLHIQEFGSVAGSVSSGADTLVLQNNGGHGGLSVLTNTTGTASLHLGNTDSSSQGGLQYDNNANTLSVLSGGSVKTSIDSSGNVTVNSGNVVIGTAGKGIDFSVNSHATGMTSELLDSYEEGTWSPTITGQTNPTSGTWTFTNGQYTKIGRLVVCSGKVTTTSTGVSSGGLYLTLPFTASNNDSSGGGSEMAISGYTCSVYGESPNSIRVVKYDFSTVIVLNHAIRLSYVFYTA